ncbi:MAG: hypothetical protein AAFW68_08700, partial [Pseudomonadota bacterium]
MKRWMTGLLAVFLAVGCSGEPSVANEGAAQAQEKDAETAPPSYAPMAPFARLAGTAWRGQGTGPNGQPIVDVVRYDLILGGRALQSTHRLEGGDYGGRTIIFFDEGAQRYIFHYFTTAG